MGRSALAVLTVALAGAAPAAAGEATAVRLRGPALPGEVQQLVAGILALRDHEGRAFAIVDKRRAQLHVFDAMGRLWGSSAVLLGHARGDSSAPDVGQNSATMGASGSGSTSGSATSGSSATTGASNSDSTGSGTTASGSASGGSSGSTMGTDTSSGRTRADRN